MIITENQIIQNRNNHNPNYTNLSEFANNTNENKN
jgi:hypothetical protein